MTGLNDGQAAEAFATAMGVFRTTLVTFAREVANRDPQLAAMAFAVAEASVLDRFGASKDQDMSGQSAAVRDQLRKVLAAARAAIDAEADGSVDAGG